MQSRFQSQKRYNDKLKLIKKGAQNHGYLEGKRKVRLGFRSLPKPQAKLEDSASVEGSSQCGVATENNGGLWWLMVALGEVESAWDVRNGFGRKKEEEMVFLLSYTKANAENAQVRNGLGHGNITLQTSSRRSQRSDHGQVSCKAADQISRRSNG